MPSRKRIFYLKLPIATEAIIDTALELVEEEREKLYHELMAELPPVQRRFRLFDAETGEWTDL